MSVICKPSFVSNNNGAHKEMSADIAANVQKRRSASCITILLDIKRQ